MVEKICGCTLYNYLIFPKVPNKPINLINIFIGNDKIEKMNKINTSKNV